MVSGRVQGERGIEQVQAEVTTGLDRGLYVG